MSATFKWNRREVAATILVCGAAVAFTTSWLTLYTEPVAADEVEKVELFEPIPTITELPVPVIDAVPPVPATESSEPPVTLPTYTIAPCVVEDADNCYWDAALMGNGQGTSFVTLNGVTYYPVSK